MTGREPGTRRCGGGMNQGNAEHGSTFSPRDFMRTRRPELFSDAILSSSHVPPIDKTVFEFHFDTLTSRKEEIRFEHFCRRLAEKEICPNLTPQTGPTGGGDSKVDAETYPVDESIAERWYHGEQQAASERWAFAFSAKKDWRTKVKSDVQKIVDTGRGYPKIFFMTNQAVSDRNRAILEDELSAGAGADVRILDRTWIIDRVYKNERWDVVYQTLDLDRPASEPSCLHGPLDTQRMLELKELDDQIVDAERYERSDYQLVEDCLQTALLARGLGAKREELEGRFDRAERLARARNDEMQIFRVLYNRAWTTYWWFEDFDTLDRLYGDAEPLVIGSSEVWNLEKLVNLWQVGMVASVLRADESGHQRWIERSERLQSALSAHASDEGRPTSSLWAETELCLTNFTLTAIANEPVTSILTTLRGILERADGLLDYPFDSVLQIVKELGPVLGDQPEFDSLFELVMALQSARAGRGEEGRLRIERGRQKLEAGDRYGAISQFAKAQTLLAHEEHREEFMLALAGTALGYDAAGLSWAARANMVLALDRSLSEFRLSGSVAPQAVPLLRKLIWLELQLGRVPAALLWIDMLNVISQAVQLDEGQRAALQDEHTMVEAVLCILILRTRVCDWLSLDRVPEYLETLHLPMAREAALFALGHESMFRSEFDLPDEDLDEFFGLLLQQPAAHDLPDTAEWNVGDPVVMESSILGCRVRLVAQNQPITLAWGETIFAFLEAFFSTVLAREGTIAMRPALGIEVGAADTPTSTPLECAVEEDDCGETSLRIVHSTDTIAECVRHDQFHDAFAGVLARVLALLQLPKVDGWLESYFAEERAQDRSGVSAQSILSLSNVLGECPRYHMDAQIDDSIKERLQYVREVPWQAPDVDVPWKSEPARGDSDGQHAVPEFRAQRHKDIEIVSIINVPLWDAARWKGTMFLTSPSPDVPPVLALWFEDEAAASKIMSGLQSKFGPIDEREQISVSIITGVDAENPAHYRVAIGSKLPEVFAPDEPAGYIINALRFQEMTPSSSANLDRFLEAFASQGRYLLGAASGREKPEVLSPMIGKRAIDIVPAWTIGPNDLLVSALLGVESPVVPNDEANAPVWDALKRIAEVRGGGHDAED